MEEKELQSSEGWEKSGNVLPGCGAKNVVIKLGDKGAYYATEAFDGLVPAVKDVESKTSQVQVLITLLKASSCARLFNYSSRC
jgi:sugar/nucleoside kinase (ribokinase family)